MKYIINLDFIVKACNLSKYNICLKFEYFKKTVKKYRLQKNTKYIIIKI